MEPILRIEQLVKQYSSMETPVLRGLNLSINAGEIYGFLGPNGTGKTTAVSIISGLLKPDSGTVTLLEHNLFAHTRYIKEHIGVVPQNIALFPDLTAWENLRVFGAMYSMSNSELKRRINELLELYGLAHAANQPIKTYSGGMKRSINIIAGILHRPSFLMLDEPTVGIDVQTKNLILENLKRLNQEGTTILYTSHDMDEAQHFCTRVGIIDQGQIIVEETPQKLIHSHAGCDNLGAVYLQLTGKSLRN